VLTVLNNVSSYVSIALMSAVLLVGVRNGIWPVRQFDCNGYQGNRGNGC